MLIVYIYRKNITLNQINLILQSLGNLQTDEALDQRGIAFTLGAYDLAGKGN